MVEHRPAINDLPVDGKARKRTCKFMLDSLLQQACRPQSGALVPAEGEYCV